MFRKTCKEIRCDRVKIEDCGQIEWEKKNKKSNSEQKSDERDSNPTVSRKKKQEKKKKKAGAHKGLHNYILLICFLLNGKLLGLNLKLLEFLRKWLRWVGFVYSEWVSDHSKMKHRLLTIDLLEDLTKWRAYGDSLEFSDLSNFADNFKESVNIRQLLAFCDFHSTWWNPTANLGGSFETDNFVSYLTFFFSTSGFLDVGFFLFFDVGVGVGSDFPRRRGF